MFKKHKTKIFFLIILNIIGTAYFLHASSEALQSSRKGLPREMVVTADELRERQVEHKNFLLLDARSRKSYTESHIQGALYFSDSDAALKENLKKYSKDTPIVTYCSSGGCQASAVLALQIKRMGFKDVKAMEDGIQTWDKKGYPVIRVNN